MMWLRHCALILATVICVCGAGDSNSPFPLGSQQRCATNDGARATVFEVLAGGGWDNLRNHDMAMLMELNYSRCRTTDDGRYLIPDNLYTIPIKRSKVDTYAEMFAHWNDYTSTTAMSINAHAGLTKLKFSVSGKFSYDHEHVKSHQYFDKAVTTRVQVRYARYVAKLAPGSPLSTEFRSRLRKIGAHDSLNRTDSARYESQILVRDFGTHVVTSIDVGATLSQVDHLQRSFVTEHESQKSTILASASASFLKLFNFGVDFSRTTSTEMTNTYMQKRTSSEVETYGGPMFQPKSFSANDWANSIKDDMVAMDRIGDPLYYVINEDTLPDLPSFTVNRIRKYVKEAVELYYKHNAYHGCTNPESPHFSFQANVDDGTCEPPKANFTFGGLYQQCQGSGYTDLCANMQQKNPLTNDYSCPTGYEAIQIQDRSKSASTTRHECHRCGLWHLRNCCADNTYSASAQYEAYWCAATGHVSHTTGFLFGGLFTNTVKNLVTGSTVCPEHFYPLRVLDDLSVCVSDDFELGTPNSLPFAGFFSCKSGNPLAMEQNAGLLQSGKPSKLKAFMMGSGVAQYPKKCPKGYSQHLAVNDRGCEINYCIKSGALTSQELPKVMLPPFMDMPHDEPESSTAMLINADGSIWTAIDNATDTVPSNLTESGLPMSSSSNYTQIKESAYTGHASGSREDNGSGSKGLSRGGVAAISIVTTLACVALVVVTARVVSRRRRRLYNQEL